MPETSSQPRRKSPTGVREWPDGKPFDEWDCYGAVELDVPSNVEISKKNKAWGADAVAERNRWRETIWQKIVQRVALGVTENPGLDCLGVAAAPGYGKPWIAFARQKFTRSGFDERSNHLE